MRLSKFLYPYWALCFLLTHLPPSSVPSGVSSLDKVVHGGGYFILGLLLFCKVKKRLATFALIVTYSLVDEITQPLIGRTFEWLDLLADSLGGAAGIILAMKIFPDESNDQSKLPR